MVVLAGLRASVLISPTAKRQSEKNAGPNVTVRGFAVIDKAKAPLETQCPSTLSCADIIAPATGRREGLISNPNGIVLPGPTFTMDTVFQTFAVMARVGSFARRTVIVFHVGPSITADGRLGTRERKKKSFCSETHKTCYYFFLSYSKLSISCDGQSTAQRTIA